MIPVFELAKIFRALDGAAIVGGRFNLITKNTDVLKEHGAQRENCSPAFYQLHQNTLDTVELTASLRGFLTNVLGISWR
jgi:hypothetical protein